MIFELLCNGVVRLMEGKSGEENWKIMRIVVGK
jgi:hypothetical protein